MARHGRQEQANEWGAPMTNRGQALVRDIREIVATHDLADIQIRRKVELLAEVAEPNGLERATMQTEVGKIRARQCEIARRCTDRMFGGGYAGREGEMATILGKILNRYRVEIDMVNLAIDTAWEWERELGFFPSVRCADSSLQAVACCTQPATSPRSNPEDCRGAAESRQSRDFGAFIRGSQGDNVGFSPSVSGGAADSSPIRWSQGTENGATHDARETRCRAYGEGSGAMAI